MASQPHPARVSAQIRDNSNRKMCRSLRLLQSVQPRFVRQSGAASRPGSIRTDRERPSRLERPSGAGFASLRVLADSTSGATGRFSNRDPRRFADAMVGIRSSGRDLDGEDASWCGRRYPTPSGPTCATIGPRITRTRRSLTIRCRPSSQIGRPRVTHGSERGLYTRVPKNTGFPSLCACCFRHSRVDRRYGKGTGQEPP